MRRTAAVLLLVFSALAAAGCGAGHAHPSARGLAGARLVKLEVAVRRDVDSMAGMGAPVSSVTVYPMALHAALRADDETGAATRTPRGRPAYLVVARGHFTCQCPTPPGARIAPGNAITMVLDRRTLTDAGDLSFGGPVKTSKLGHGFPVELVRECAAVVAAGPVVGCGGRDGPFGNRGSLLGGLNTVGYALKSHEGASASSLWLGPIASRAVLLGVRPEHPEDARNVFLRYSVSSEESSKPHPVRGFVIQPHTRVFITIGFRPSTPGTYLLRGFIVDYRVSGVTYSAAEPLGISMCPVADPACGRGYVRRATRTSFG
jgi:hypothetical protein